MRIYLVLLCCLLAGSVRAEDFNILDCGAVRDGTTLATPAIQKAIDRCASTGGGTVTVPAGRFLTNTVFLKSNVNLHLGQGAVLLGGTDPKAFTQAIVYADGIENASITGTGTIDGQGFKKYYPTNGSRHNDIRLFRSRKITVQDVTLVNSPSWVFRILECDGVIVRGVRIYSFVNENNDGIDIDGKNITISDYPENRMFGSSLPAYGLYVRHVKNPVFEDFRFNLAASDARPAVLLDDCHNVKLIDFDVAAPSDEQPLIRLIQSTNITLSGYQSVAPVTKFLRVEGKASSGIKLTGNDLTGVRSVIPLGQECEDSAVREWNNLR